jgi:Rrf2 family protein
MKISAKAEYACLAMIALAHQGPDSPPLRIRDISLEYEIPERYLVQILLQLKRAGLVTSTRGASGGYHLSRAPELISLNEVLNAIDGPELSGRNTEASSRPASKALAAIWEQARSAERAVLESATIAQLAERTSPQEWVI